MWLPSAVVLPALSRVLLCRLLSGSMAADIDVLVPLVLVIWLRLPHGSIV